MKTTFKLTFIAALVLGVSACSGGSGAGAASSVPKNENQPLNMESSKQENSANSKISTPLQQDDTKSENVPASPSGNTSTDMESVPAQPNDSKKPENSIPPSQAGNKTEPEQSVLPKQNIPDIENPEAPTAPPESPNELTEKEIFENMDHFSGNSSEAEQYLRLELDGKEIKLAYIANNIIDESKEDKVLTLRDESGSLLGYYGYAAFTEQKKPGNGSDELIPLHQHLVLASGVSQQKQLPEITAGKALRYVGSMFYSRNGEQLPLTAKVNAIYENKKLNMNITDEDSGDSWFFSNADVGDDGSVIAKLRLRDEPIYDGVFNGAMYGKNGDAIIGKAEGNDPNKSESWIGVIGATLEK